VGIPRRTGGRATGRLKRAFGADGGDGALIAGIRSDTMSR
jgi:hypothetical protein